MAVNTTLVDESELLRGFSTDLEAEMGMRGGIAFGGCF